MPAWREAFASALRVSAALVGILAALLFMGASPVAGAPDPNGAVRLMLALDTSGSMKANDPERLLPHAAALMMHLLDDQDSLGLLRFDTAPDVVLEPGPLTQIRRHLGLRQLARLTPRGEYTDIPAVLEAALKSFTAMPAGQSGALVLITDGRIDLDPRKKDATSWTKRLQQDILPAYQRDKIAIFTVAFTPKADQKFLKELAGATQGEFFLVDKAADLHSALVRVYENLKKPQLAPLINHRFTIDSKVAEAVLVATREKPGRPVSLTDPLGRQLTPKNAPGQVRWFAAPAFDLVTIPQPRPGVWNLSGCKGGEGKMVLHTDLKLVCPHLPAEIGSDEELVVGALVCEGDRPVTQGELLKHLLITAELAPEGGEPVHLELGAVPADQQEVWPPSARVGRFQPVRSPGTARLRVRVLGKTFERELNFIVKVVMPWYRGEFSGGSDMAPGRLAFLPAGKGPPGKEMQGWLSLQPGSGGLAALLFKPPTPGAFSVALPPECPLPLKVDLRLTGGTPEGRPLIIRPAVPFLQAAAPEPKEPPPAPTLKGKIKEKLWNLVHPRPQAASSLKARRSWLLAGLGAWLLVVAGLLWLARKHLPFHRLPGLGPLLSAADGVARQQKLLSAARIESLEKEKMVLQGELDQMSAKLRQAAGENAELLSKIEQQSLKYRDKAKVINELEQKLEEAETEAKAVQEEYMALYARSQAEKGLMEKN